jgi:membrane-associated protein
VSAAVYALPAILDGKQLFVSAGLPLALFIVFAETGLLLGFFLPGDSLLFAAGYAASGGLGPKVHPNVVLVCVAMSIVAFIGAEVGYLIGRKAGPELFDKSDSRLFKASYVTKAREVLDSYGEPKAIILARFVPVVRTFLNPLAGTVGVPLRTFTLWNAVGALLWGTGVVLLGYYLGQVSVIGKNLEVFAALVVLISVIPIAREILKQRRRTDRVPD